MHNFNILDHFGIFIFSSKCYFGKIPFLQYNIYFSHLAWLSSTKVSFSSARLCSWSTCRLLAPAACPGQVRAVLPGPDQLLLDLVPVLRLLHARPDLRAPGRTSDRPGAPGGVVPVHLRARPGHGALSQGPKKDYDKKNCGISWRRKFYNSEVPIHYALW